MAVFKYGVSSFKNIHCRSGTAYLRTYFKEIQSVNYVKNIRNFVTDTRKSGRTFMFVFIG